VGFLDFLKSGVEEATDVASGFLSFLDDQTDSAVKTAVKKTKAKPRPKAPKVEARLGAETDTGRTLSPEDKIRQVRSTFGESSGVEKFASGATDLLFGGVKKGKEALDVLTGHTQRRLDEIDEREKSGEISKSEATKLRNEFLKNTEFAGFEGAGEEDLFGRARKALGVGGEAALDLSLFGGLSKSGAKAAGKTLTKEAGKTATKRATAEGAGIGAALELQKDEITPLDIVKGAAGGAALGFGASKVITKLGSTFAKAKDADSINRLLADERGAILGPGKTPKRVIASVPPPDKPFREAALDVVSPTRTTETGKTLMEEGAENINKRLTQNQQLVSRLDNIAPDIDVSPTLKKRLLEGLEVAEPKPIETLKGIRRSRNFMADTMGASGGNVVDRLATAVAKKSSLDDVVRPLLQKVDDVAGKAAKSKFGRREANATVRRVLEDRANAETILADASGEVKTLYKEVQKSYDYGKNVLVRLGFPVRENYSPRVMKDIISSADSLDAKLQQTLKDNLKIESKFLKARAETPEVPESLLDDPVSLLPKYFSSVNKHIAFQNMDEFIQKEIQNIDPVYLRGAKDRQNVADYLALLIKDTTSPGSLTKGELRAMKVLNTTYANSLRLNPKLALQNRTQKWWDNARVSKETLKTVERVTKENSELFDDLFKRAQNKQGIISGELGSEFQPREGVIKRLDDKYGFGGAEAFNIRTSYNKGVVNSVTKTDAYKALRKQGIRPAEAIASVLEDPAVARQAVKDANVLVNWNHFGANKANMGAIFRKKGYIKFFTQYKGFRANMTENIVETMRPNHMRELDVLMRGNPMEVPVVDMARTVDAFGEATDEIIKGVQKGDVTDLTLKEVRLFERQLKELRADFNKQLKAISNVRSSKNLAAMGKIWATSAGILFMANGGQNLGRSIFFASPVDVPSPQKEDPIRAVADVASSPFSPFGGVRSDKLINLIPGLGLASNRARDIRRFIEGLQGGE